MSTREPDQFPEQHQPWPTASPHERNSHVALLLTLVVVLFLLATVPYAA
jgi:hypothetical protein